MMTTSDSRAPGTEISNGNCRTGGGQSNAVTPAQTKIPKSSMEHGSEITGLLSAVSFVVTLPVSFSLATPRIARKIVVIMSSNNPITIGLPSQPVPS